MAKKPDEPFALVVRRSYPQALGLAVRVGRLACRWDRFALMAIGHGSNVIEKSWTDELVRLIDSLTKLDTQCNIPLAGGISESAKTVYLDKSIPLCYNERGIGKRVQAAKYLRVHEFVEKAVMDLLVRLGADPSKVYAPAHAVATAAEKAAVRNDGFDLKEYGRFWDKGIASAAKHKLGDGTPKNLELKPYEADQ